MPSDPQQTAADASFYVTTPIYYVNARPHIGHAYTTLVADTVARRQRLLGRPTFFLTGTDEHGQKIERSAAAAGIPPQQFADQVSKSFEDLWKRMGITNDAYIRTTDPKHKQGVQHLFQQLKNNGAIYKGTYTGQYCVSDEAYVDGPPGIHCPDCGRLTETVSESNYYFRLSAFQRPLLDLIESNSLRIQPDSRRNEVLSFLRGPVTAAAPEGPGLSRPEATPPPEGHGFSRAESIPSQAGASAPEVGSANAGPDAHFQTLASSANESVIPTKGAAGSEGPASPGNSRPNENPLHRTAAGTPYLPGALKDLSISRTSFRWGIPVPGDEEHVIYVWLDALANYMTALGYGEPEHPLFDQFWPADLHLVGKEIIRFHCVYWPAFLLALNPAWATTTHPATNSPLLSSRSAAEGPASSSHQGPTAPHTPTPTDLSSRPERSKAEGPASPTPALPNQSEGHGFSRAENAPTSDGASAPEGSSSLAFDPTWAAKMLPKSVIAHGWLLFEESKMSKSRGNIVRTETILDAFGEAYLNGIREHNTRELKKDAAYQSVAAPTEQERDLFATDVLRYFLLREIPFGQDGSFSFDSMITRYNADLANGYGNLVSRTLSMIGKLCAGITPTPQTYPSHDIHLAWRIPVGGSAGLPEETAVAVKVTGPEIADVATAAIVFYSAAFPVYRFVSQFDRSKVNESGASSLAAQTSRAGVLDAIAFLIAQADSFLTSTAPWKLAKANTDEAVDQVSDILYTAAESIRILTALLYPILPYATAKVWAQLGLGSIEEAATRGDLRNLQWGGLKPGTRLGPLAPIFPRAPKELAQTMADIEAQKNAPADLTNVANAEHDASTTNPTQFRQAPLASTPAGTPDQPLAAEAAGESSPNRPGAPSMAQSHRDMGGSVGVPVNPDSTSPAAPPRPTSQSPNPIAEVGGSTATTPSRPDTLPHTQAQPSGIFAGTPTSGPGDAAPQITIDDFAKIELRIAQVTACDRVPKADKLLRLDVNLGFETRQILSGIAEFYTPEDMIGRRIIVITNLAPRKMRGLDSHGMLLAASGPPDGPDGGKPILATVPEGVPIGTRLK